MMKMSFKRNDLFHYSNEKIIIDKNYEYVIKNLNPYKPAGFWISIGTVWKDWCLMEDFEIDNLKWTNEIEILDSANLKIINDIKELEQFHNEYSITDLKINWNKLIDQYDGIFIDMFPFYTNFNISWHSMWDVPSGCIWNLDIIKIGAQYLTEFD